MTSSDQLKRTIAACRRAGLPVVEQEDCTCGLRGRLVVLARSGRLEVVWPYDRRCPIHGVLVPPRRRASPEDALDEASDVTSCEQGCIHPGCDRPPRVCRECVRAASLQWWGAIVRHDDGPPRCELCEIGHAEVCGECFVDDVTEHRAQMRRLGDRLGEPERPDAFEI